MNNHLQDDLNQIDKLLEQTKNQGVAFLNGIDSIPPSKKKIEIETNELSVEGVGANEALSIFNEKLKNVMVSAAGPRYWGYVMGGSTPASIMGDWLTTIYEQCPMSISGQGDISAIVELETIHLLKELFGLPDDFFGGFVSGATISNFTCLAVARQWFGSQLGIDVAKNGLVSGCNVITANAHSSSIKSLAMLGLGSKNIIQIDQLEDREAMDMRDLKEKIKTLNGEPFILISSAGTVNTVDFDDFKAISKLKTQYNFWWHIDAAFGAFSACSPNYNHLVKKWEYADSITVDNHKWLNVPYDSAVFFIKEEHKLLQVNTFQNSDAPYLGDPFENFNYINLQPQNSRRLRALPAWFSLMAYGKEGYRHIVENNIYLAKLLGNYIESSKEFQLLAPVRLNTVCFTMADEQDSSIFLKELNDTGKVFMTPTVFKGKPGIRAALVNWRTKKEDIDTVWEEMKKVERTLFK